ncbi:uncharacterized protein Z518_03019 [Rhinocladiella mackenziei CBS 650.93]|uniref:Uncharacterized protein n=1 Tax=Rhinocladiella mackenziei CBS 650.93 TaxID=1442369 RepID=A0A0D2HD11_9EURO|nr:uncharacterized protein Z518_03019 [Rhinocladiella mackenziei CBS 650.93]KIX08363.1 hypothetical protein Z518_03019 [Rhinocladiella mackenziei CBS 650.93]
MTSWASKLAAGLLVVAAMSTPSAGAPQASSTADPAIITLPPTAPLNPPQDPPPDLASFDDVPYPPLPADWDTNVTVTNLLGTRLYGWIGCSPDDREKIRGAYDDFHFLADQPEITAGFIDGKLRTGIDWTDQAAKDFWGPVTGKNRASDNDRNAIQILFDNLQQV